MQATPSAALSVVREGGERQEDDGGGGCVLGRGPGGDIGLGEGGLGGHQAPQRLKRDWRMAVMMASCHGEWQPTEQPAPAGGKRTSATFEHTHGGAGEVAMRVPLRDGRGGAGEGSGRQHAVHDSSPGWPRRACRVLGRAGHFCSCNLFPFPSNPASWFEM